MYRRARTNAHQTIAAFALHATDAAPLVRAVATVILVRVVMKPIPALGEPATSLLELAKIWRLLAANFTMFIMFAVMAVVMAIIQTWCAPSRSAIARRAAR